MIILFQITVCRKRHVHSDWLTDVKLRPITAQKMDTDSRYRSQLKLSIAAYERKTEDVRETEIMDKSLQNRKEIDMKNYVTYSKLVGCVR